MSNISYKELVRRQYQDKMFSQMALESSRSVEDAMKRLDVYSKVYSNYDDLVEGYKAYSGYAETPIHTNQYFNATMASNIRSFAGFVAVERNMDQPTSLLWFSDLLGVTDNRVVLPNIGKDNLAGINSRFQANSAFTPGQNSYSLTTNKKLIPGSVELQLIHIADSSAPIIIKDDRKGNLLAPAGILAKGEVEYTTGLIRFEVSPTGFVIAPGDKFSVIGFEDVAGDPTFGQLTGPGNNRFKVNVQNITATSEPDMLVGESNLMTMAMAQKAIGINLSDIVGSKLTELYTKLINNKMVDGVISNATGDTVSIDMNAYTAKFTDYNSRLDAFKSDLVEVDSAIAKRTTKAIKATAYIVGDKVGDYFRKLKTTGSWVENTESTYINDLLGYVDGIPVLRHMNVGSNDGYAIHKTADGELAPMMRGIFLPLTNTPVVGNYNNPTQQVTGVYYQESNTCILPELIQKFTIN